MVLKRLFMSMGRVATAVLSAADPTPGRLVPAHARSARRYGSPDDPIFLEARVRPVTETFCEIRVSSGFFLTISKQLEIGPTIFSNLRPFLGHRQD